MWQIKIFKTEKSMLSFLKKNGNKIEFQEIFVNNGFGDRKSTRLNSSHPSISYAVFCLKKKKKNKHLLFIYIHNNLFFFFFFNDTATTEIYTLSLHDALPISSKHKIINH